MASGLVRYVTYYRI